MDGTDVSEAAGRLRRVRWPSGTARRTVRVAVAGIAGIAAVAFAAGGLVVTGRANPLSLPARPATAVGAPPPPPVSVAQVTTGSVRAGFAASGAVEAIDQVALAAKTGGRVVRLDAQTGARVTAGQLLVELDHTALDAQVAQAEAALATAHARRAQLERGARAEDVAAAAAQRDAAAQQARAAAGQAAAAVEGLSTLDAQVRAAQQQAAAAAAQAAAARTRVEQLLRPRTEELALLTGQVNLARIRLVQAQSRDEELSVAANQIALARVSLGQALDGARPEQIRAAQAALDQAETALAQITAAPVRAEEIAVARIAWEAADAAWRSAQDVLADARRGHDAARRDSDNLPPYLTRTQADGTLAQAGATLHNAEASVEARRAQRDQARLRYEQLAAGATGWDVRLAQERVEAARAQLELVRNPDPARVRAAQLGVEQAQLQLDARREQLAFDAQAAAEGVQQAEAQLAKLERPSPLDVDALEAQAAAAEAQAQAALAHVDALASQRRGAEYAAAAADEQAAAARSAAGQAEAAFALRASPYTAEDLRAARAAAEQAQAALEAARAARADAFVYAPFDGVFASRAVSVGALAAPAAPLAVLVSDGVEVSVPVEEARVASVRPGQTATLTAPAVAGREFAGTVTSVSPAGDPRARAFTARIRPEPGAEGALRPGMFVQVAFAGGEPSDVPIAPRAAIVASGVAPGGAGGSPFAFVVGTDDRLARRPVQLGGADGEWVEILGGLAPGELVVVSGPDSLREGQSVAPRGRWGTRDG